MPGMKMALASAQDMEAAYELCGLIDAISRGYYPAREGDPDDTPTFFDENDRDHLRALYDRVAEIAESAGGIHRVVGGFSTVSYAKNQILDLSKDTVELHPRLLAALRAVEELERLRPHDKRLRFFWIGEESEIFVANTIRQLAADEGNAGTGIERWEDHPDRGVLLFDSEGESIEWGELDPLVTRMTLRMRDENERPRETVEGNLLDLYACTDGGRFNLPVMFCTQYN